MSDGSFGEMTEGVNVNDVLDSMETSAPLDYKPMPEAKTAAEPDPYKGDHDSLRKLAAERTADEQPAIERRYEYSDGSRAGQKRPDYESVKPERAADDLAATRERESWEARKRGDHDLAEALDTLRAQEGTTQADGTKAVPIQPVEQQIPQPQPVEAQQPTIDPEIAEALSKPKVRAALEEHTRQVETARQAYTQAAFENTNAALMAVFVDFPELGGLTQQQIPVAMQMLANQNPARHAQVIERIQKFAGAYQHQQQLVQQEGQRQVGEYQRISAEEDARFDESVKSEPPRVVQAVKDNVYRVVESTYGIPKDTLQRLYQTYPIFRHSAFQRLLYDATKFHLAMESLGGQKSRAAPFVQRPGASGQRPNADERETTALWQRLDKANTGTAGIRNAAAIISARRQARG